MRVLAIVALCSGVGACASLLKPGIVELAPDQYMLARRDLGGSIGNTAVLKARTIEEANAFAASKGRRAVPVPVNELPGWPTCDPLLVEYHFKLVDRTQSSTAAPAN